MKNKHLRRISFLIPVILLALLISVLNPACTSSSPGKKSVKDIVSSMSLKQKAELVIGTSRSFRRQRTDTTRNRLRGANQPQVDTVYSNMVDKVQQLVPGAAGTTSEFPELGITTQVLCDGPAGLRIMPKREGDTNTYYCTAYPIATLLASTWDQDMVNEVGKAMGNEVLEYGADIILGPAINLQRDPLCGRNFEYYSEDPLIAGKMAAAMVRGIQSDSVGTSIKHFVANNQETYRTTVDEVISQRALRELYLRSFEIAVKEGEPFTVMSSYNKVNGVYSSENPDLLTKILRDDWGFKGYVMTDWGAGSNVVAQMNAGNDLIMPGRMNQINDIITAVDSGKLDESVLDRNVSRILNIMQKEPHYRGYKYSDKPDLKAHAQVARKAATDGMVLLKNDGNALPIASDSKNVAAFGNTSYAFISGGTGSGDVNEAYTISLIDGLTNAGLVTDKDLDNVYQSYIDNFRKGHQVESNYNPMRRREAPVPEMTVSKKLAAKIAAQSDVALITIGRNSGEGRDRQAVEGDFYLTPTEKDMIKTVSDAFHAKGKKAVVILNIGGVIETASWRNDPDAILCAWQPGQEAGNAVADVLLGKVNPSGKLAVTFPMSYDDTPTAKSFPGHAVEQDGGNNNPSGQGGFSSRRQQWETVYSEDIYVGYRYYNTFNVPVAYEFGYGLSYTTFDYSNLKLSSDNFTGEMTVSVDIKNTGKVAGRAVAEVYESAPSVKLKKPEEELAAFNKTNLLQPGESQTMQFTIKTKDIASFDESTSSWVAEAGDYTIKIGASSKDIKQEAKFTVAKDIVAEKDSEAMAPQREFSRLAPK